MLLGKLWGQTKVRIAKFPGSTTEVDARPYLSLRDDIGWRGRRAEGDLKTCIRQGLVVTQWNAWLESGEEGVEALREVKVRRLNHRLEGYPYHVCKDSQKLEGEIKRRRGPLQQLRVATPREWLMKKYTAPLDFGRGWPRVFFVRFTC